MKPNFQALLDMIRICEAQEDIYMGNWFLNNDREVNNTCGTVGCLVGTYLCHRHDVVPAIKDETSMLDKQFDVADHLGISYLIFEWLFLSSTEHTSYRDLLTVTKEQALSRLRKYVYYKLRQQEMDDSWNNRCPRKGDTVECNQLILQEV